MITSCTQFYFYFFRRHVFFPLPPFWVLVMGGPYPCCETPPWVASVYARSRHAWIMSEVDTPTHTHMQIGQKPEVQTPKTKPRLPVRVVVVVVRTMPPSLGSPTAMEPVRWYWRLVLGCGGAELWRFRRQPRGQRVIQSNPVPVPSATGVHRHLRVWLWVWVWRQRKDADGNAPRRLGS